MSRERQTGLTPLHPYQSFACYKGQGRRRRARRGAWFASIEFGSWGSPLPQSSSPKSVAPMDGRTSVVVGTRRKRESRSKVSVGVGEKGTIAPWIRLRANLQFVGLVHVVCNGSVSAWRGLSFLKQVQEVEQDANELLARSHRQVFRTSDSRAVAVGCYWGCQPQKKVERVSLQTCSCRYRFKSKFSFFRPLANVIL